MSEPLSPQATPATLQPPRTVPLGRGASWLGEGFALFKRDPGVWILNTIIFFVLMFVLGMIPLISLVASLLSPVFIGGLILGCRAQDTGRPLEVAHVFAGFQHQTGRLVALGAIYLAITLFLVLVTFGLMMTFGGMNMAMMNESGPAAATPSELLPMLLVMLVVALVAIPVAMMFWFAPALVVLHPEVGVTEALGLSFKGCLRNLLPFLIYGVVLFVLAVVATIPLGLGWLVLWPVFIASVYAGYKDIYLHEAAP